jgi:CRISPR/Cas system-associated endoribonuclease Cas2
MANFLSSTKNKILLNVAGKEKSVDSQFEELKQRFEQVTEQQIIIYKNLLKQDETLRTVGNPMQQLSDALGSVYGGKKEHTDYNAVVGRVVSLMKENTVCCCVYIQCVF